MDMGLFAEMLGAVASIAAALVSVAALKTAQAANRIAQEVSDRDVYTGLQAWWCIRKTDEKWGIALANTEKIPVVYRNVKICQKGAQGRLKDKNISFGIVPPGLYFLPADREMNYWKIEPVDSVSNFEPVAVSRKGYEVKSMSYEYPDGTLVTWSQDNGLKISRNSPSQ